MSLENFKKAFFGLTLEKAAPYFPVSIVLKADHTTINEVHDRDPWQMTIDELHRHRFFLETELFKTGPEILMHYRIKVGSVIRYTLIMFTKCSQLYNKKVTSYHHKPSLHYQLMIQNYG